MNIQYCQPESNQTNLSRRTRSARIECERLELQFEANLKLAVALAALLVAHACARVIDDTADAGATEVTVDASTCDTGTWTVHCDYSLPPDMWAGHDVRCTMTQDLPEEHAALWTCVDACAPVPQ